MCVSVCFQLSRLPSTSTIKNVKNASLIPISSIMAISQ